MSALRLSALFLAGGALAVSGAWYLVRRGRKTPDQLERERRIWISATGRITDGTVTDVGEMPRNGRGPAQLLFYKYDVGGVCYEASQDVTYLRQFLDLHSCRLGLHTSLKYDPHNPSNSIVIAEGWSGVPG